MPQARSLRITAGIMLFFAIPMLAIPMFASEESEAEGPLASTAEECIEQANTQTSVDPYCQSISDYIYDFLVGKDVYDARLEADWPIFLLGLYDDSDCCNAESMGAEDSDGTGTVNCQPETEAQLVIANSWTCATFRKQLPPA